MNELIAFLRDRLDEEEVDAQEAMDALVPTGPVSRELPAEPIEWVLNRLPVAVRQHIARHDPPRVLAGVEAKRKLLNQYERVLRSKAANDAAKADLAADLAHEERTGVWAGPGLPGVRLQALRREEDYLTAMLPVLEGLVKAEAAVYADHRDYQEDWKP